MQAEKARERELGVVKPKSFKSEEREKIYDRNHKKKAKKEEGPKG